MVMYCKLPQKLKGIKDTLCVCFATILLAYEVLNTMIVDILHPVDYNFFKINGRFMQEVDEIIHSIILCFKYLTVNLSFLYKIPITSLDFLITSALSKLLFLRNLFIILKHIIINKIKSFKLLHRIFIFHKTENYLEDEICLTDCNTNEIEDEFVSNNNTLTVPDLCEVEKTHSFTIETDTTILNVDVILECLASIIIDVENQTEALVINGEAELSIEKKEENQSHYPLEVNSNKKISEQKDIPMLFQIIIQNSSAPYGIDLYLRSLMQNEALKVIICNPIFPQNT
ncbi:hypothetical protein TNCT_657621 [Trichonephila clavata]|uniref:Uncharacterized protein n=1 Tax=Trichonephila clavata TaxID=2740835 RepID=A0A8X6HNU0_TRICU|nr:hypothetical protein TNCT_657621 [Trichonephila clavata]